MRYRNRNVVSNRSSDCSQPCFKDWLTWGGLWTVGSDACGFHGWHKQEILYFGLCQLEDTSWCELLAKEKINKDLMGLIINIIRLAYNIN